SILWYHLIHFRSISKEKLDLKHSSELCVVVLCNLKQKLLTKMFKKCVNVQCKAKNAAYADPEYFPPQSSVPHLTTQQELNDRWFRFVAMFTSNQLLELMAQIMGAFQETLILIRLHHGKQQFSIGKDALLVLAVLKTDRRVEARKTREETFAGVAALIQQSPINQVDT
ncbi:hypothetical protein C0J52_26714, partial [Blattella germanica]